MPRRLTSDRMDPIVLLADRRACDELPWQAGDGTSAPEVERRRRPSEAVFIEFLLQELRESQDRTSELEALMARAAWRLVS